jgi:hypothetical protein
MAHAPSRARKRLLNPLQRRRALALLFVGWSENWLKSKDPAALVVKREAEEGDAADPETRQLDQIKRTMRNASFCAHLIHRICTSCSKLL